MPQQEIPKTLLGRTGLQSSRLGLAGSHGIDADSVERAFHEWGINHFYVTQRMRGLVEGVRRLVKAGHRDRLVLHGTTMLPTGGGVRRAWEAVARALGVECIDVFQVGWVRSRWYLGGKTWPAMLDLKREGKVKALGISTHERPLAAPLAQEMGLDLLMIRYNAAHRGAERDIFDKLGDSRPGIVAYTATRWGRLLQATRGLGPMTAPECYRFQLGHPQVDVALFGPASWEELSADAKGVLEGPLSAPRLEEVKAFGDAVRAGASSRFFGR